MIEHKIDKNNNYSITINGKEVLSIQLDQLLDQVIISTENEIFAGPVELLKLTQEIK